MRSFIYREVGSTDSVSDRYICVNNFGFYENIDNMDLRREKGRLDYQLIYVKKGEILVGHEGDEHVLNVGDVCLFRPKEAQIYKIKGKSTSFYWIHFSGSEAEAMLSFFKERKYNVGIFAEFEDYCRGGLNSAYNFSELMHEGNLIVLFAKLGQRICNDNKKDGAAMKIQPALAAINSDSQAHLSNEELAELCGLSKYYFIKVFKEATGCTPQQYYNSVIVNKACYLFENSDYNVAEISNICGIEDGLYFSRMFKKQTGLSPRNYRKNTVNKRR